MPTTDYIKAIGINYTNELRSIHKSRNPLQPVYEAFCNAWEAIIENVTTDFLSRGKITMSFYYDKGVFDGDNSSLNHIVVSDNGIGVNQRNFDRVITLRDSSKGISNKGTGRVQFLHFFDTTTFDSVYKEGKSYTHLNLCMSKNDAFLKQNSILRIDLKESASTKITGTSVTLSNLLDSKNDAKFFNETSLDDIKKDLIKHFLSLFCENSSRLPKIRLDRYENDILTETKSIVRKDIPKPDKNELVVVPLSKLDETNKVVDSVSTESFELSSFVQSETTLSSNSIFFVSKGALAQECSIDSLEKNDAIDGKRYMFLLRGRYFDSVDDDLRGNLHLVKEADFKRQNESSLYPEECLLVDRIKEVTNSKINDIYPHFTEKHQDALRNLDELKDMFMIDENVISSMKRRIKTSDSDEKILCSMYQSEMESIAKNDAKLKVQYEQLKELSPEQTDYQDKLNKQVTEFVKLIPLQNRANLTKYLARRKLVLDIFKMILDKELDNLKDGKRINEDLLHNLIFQQHSTDTSNSDLWLIDDQYIYFQGCSEKDFNHIEIGNERLIKPDEELTEEQLLYKTRNGRKDIGDRRPDILLYPAEGKCIIIEFKAPDVNVSEHLMQINRYAMMIRNLSADRFNIVSFYGYLIGEDINYDDIQENDSSFKNSPTLDYIFRPSYEVTGKFGREHGYLYTEIIKYSDILKRASARNKIFIEKLEGK